MSSRYEVEEVGERDVRLRKTKLLLRVMGVLMVWPRVVRIAVVEGGRAGMLGAVVRIRGVVLVAMAVGRKAARRRGRRYIAEPVMRLERERVWLEWCWDGHMYSRADRDTRDVLSAAAGAKRDSPH